MSIRDGSTRRQHESALHEIRVQGHLDDRWAHWVEGLTFTRERDGTTTLTGPLLDQAALHGVLTRIRDLGLPLVSLRRVCPDRPDSEASHASEGGSISMNATKRNHTS